MHRYHEAMLAYWTTVAIALAGFGISIYSLRAQLKRSQFQQSIDLLFRLEGNFFGKDKQAARAEAARGIREENFAEAEPILDFFETIALLTQRGALDEFMVWHTFFYWINNYYELSKEHINARQKEAPSYWSDLSRFVPRLRELAAKERGLASAAATVPTKQQLNEFLNEEQAEAARQR